MATRPINARDWLFEVEDAGGVWLPIAGIKSFVNNPSENREVADTTDFDSDGHYEEEVMQTGGTITLEGHYEVDTTTGEQDPGQAYVDTVWAVAHSVDSLNRIRFRHETQTTTWAVWDATVTPGERGEGTNAKTSWSATVRRSGAPTTMAVV